MSLHSRRDVIKNLLELVPEESLSEGHWVLLTRLRDGEPIGDIELPWELHSYLNGQDPQRLWPVLVEIRGLSGDRFELEQMFRRVVPCSGKFDILWSSGYSYGSGLGLGFGDGFGDGIGNGNSNCYGASYGYGIGFGSGDGYGGGNGNGDGYGYGYDNGFGNGSGDGSRYDNGFGDGGRGDRVEVGLSVCPYITEGGFSVSPQST